MSGKYIGVSERGKTYCRHVLSVVEGHLACRADAVAMNSRALSCGVRAAVAKMQRYPEDVA